jgi:signal transduction histidine kinase/HPt (histidine-containing phosphotransfer) domain-containing protein
VDLSPFAIPSALWQFSTALIVLRLLGTNLGWTRRGKAETAFPGELKTFVRAAALWLVLGFLLAFWTGRNAGESYRQNLLSRVQVGASLVNPAHAEAILGPEFRWDQLKRLPQPGNSEILVASVPFLIEAAKPLRLSLDRLLKMNPDVYWTQFMTEKDGYSVVAGLPQSLPAKKDTVPVLGLFTDRERAWWKSRDVVFEEPFFTDYGEMIRVRAPVQAADGRMLGWVAFELGAVRWAAVQAVARLQTFALIGVGILLALFVNLQRQEKQERERSSREATVALEADRAKTAFLAKVSHELRTPLQSILGYSENLADQPLVPEARRCLGAVRTQSRLLIRLVNDLLDLSALQAGAFQFTPKPGNLGEIVRMATESLLPRAAAKGLGLRVEIAADVPACLAFDADRVRMVLLNLVTNAIKFTVRGEIRVRLTVSGTTGTGAVALMLAVRDTGPGIAPEDQARLFRPFSRLQEHGDIEGSGLGLALSSALCQSMAGGLSMESDGANGSTFTARLVLPLAVPDPGPAATTPIDLRWVRVLVADDNRLVRDLFTTNLRQAGAWTDVATDGLEAVELCAREKYSVVVLDLSMPWLNGLEAARRIRAVAPGPLRIVGVSAHAGGSDRELALAAGMDLLLIKPIDKADLLAAVAGKQVAVRPAPPSGSPNDLVELRRMRRMFIEEVPWLKGELQEARDASDRRKLRARAHYLKNSADVAGFREVSLLCAELEARAQDQNADPDPVLAELSRLLRQIHTPLSPDMSSDINQQSNPS